MMRKQLDDRKDRVGEISMETELNLTERIKRRRETIRRLTAKHIAEENNVDKMQNEVRESIGKKVREMLEEDAKEKNKNQGEER